MIHDYPKIAAQQRVGADVIGVSVDAHIKFAATKAVLLSTLLMASGRSAAENTLEDFAAVTHFASANAALHPDPARVVFIGDSITASWADESFIKDNPHFVDRGISGQTAPQMLLRFRADAIDLHPAVIHIMAGTNDVAENIGAERDSDIQNAIASMVELALEHHIKVILASIPPTKDFPWRAGLNPAPRIVRLNAWLKAYAARMHIEYLDYWPALAADNAGMKPDVSQDGVHPNAEGYRRMQPLAHAAILRALRTKD